MTFHVAGNHPYFFLLVSPYNIHVTAHISLTESNISNNAL